VTGATRYVAEVADRPTDPDAWQRLRSICERLPGVTERPSHGEVAWFSGSGKRARQFASTWDHHHDDRNAVVMAAAPGVQERLVADDPEHFFRPPYVGSKGWIGIYLDTADLDWDLIELHLTDAHTTVTDAR
jgi:hypothetical protein